VSIAIEVAIKELRVELAALAAVVADQRDNLADLRQRIAAIEQEPGLPPAPLPSTGAMDHVPARLRKAMGWKQAERR
jgi:hypothetical protein